MRGKERIPLSKDTLSEPLNINLPVSSKKYPLISAIDRKCINRGASNATTPNMRGWIWAS